MKTKIHALAGVIGFLTILTFWLSTVYSELFGSEEMIASAKAMVLQGMFVLIPAMIIAGGSGMSLGGKRSDTKALAKKKRMPFIAANGVLVLIPAAIFLDSKASIGIFDTSFYVVQTLELVAGAVNITLMGLNIRDGLTMTGRIGTKVPIRESRDAPPQISDQDGGPLIVTGLKRLIDQNGELCTTKPVIALCRCGASKRKPYCDGSHNEIGFDSRYSEDHTPDELQKYAGDDIDVFYNKLLCSHAGECAKLKSVFDSSREPWIVPNNGSTPEVINIVKLCPSGALSYSIEGKTPQHEVSDEQAISIEKDGPYRVSGIQLASARSCEGACRNKMALCRCGASKNKPYCDGSHQDINWNDQA